jgi:G:T-mismatch repair DNA endonuclease (very short patch repair protein)
MSDVFTKSKRSEVMSRTVAAGRGGVEARLMRRLKLNDFS